jgi:hypothetical protein
MQAGKTEKGVISQYKDKEMQKGLEENKERGKANCQIRQGQKRRDQPLVVL